MTALAKERTMRMKRAGGLDFPVAADVKIFKGAFVVLAAGYLAPATDDADLTPVGRADDRNGTVDNTGGGAGDAMCFAEFPREKCLFPFIGDAGAPFTQADVGKQAYLLDDQTVTATATGHSAAGTVWKIETKNNVQTVWVELANA